MKDDYRLLFGLHTEPFSADIRCDQILVTETVSAVAQRIDYAMRIGAIALVTGEIGSGKSTALRYVSERMHPAQHLCLYITATTGSILELYRQIVGALGLANRGVSKALMLQTIRQQIVELCCAKKIKLLLIIDEASLLRMEVLAELHTLVQFEKDAKPYLPLVLAGQNNLLDALCYRTAAPLASRVVARSHLEAVKLQEIKQYIEHHLAIAGLDHNPFDDPAVIAIHQGSGGLLRKANHLARGALIVAAKQKSLSVGAEHVRLAATELI
jgi:type II secretory pathway predicted ATPase ExeA